MKRLNYKLIKETDFINLGGKHCKLGDITFFKQEKMVDYDDEEEIPILHTIVMLNGIQEVSFPDEDSFIFNYFVQIFNSKDIEINTDI